MVKQTELGMLFVNLWNVLNTHPPYCSSKEEICVLCPLSLCFSNKPTSLGFSKIIKFSKQKLITVQWILHFYLLGHILALSQPENTVLILSQSFSFFLPLHFLYSIQSFLFILYCGILFFSLFYYVFWREFVFRFFLFLSINISFSSFLSSTSIYKIV